MASELSFDLTVFTRGKNEASGSVAGASSALERLHARVQQVAVCAWHAGRRLAGARSPL